MEIFYKDTKIGSLGHSSKGWEFTIKTRLTHKTYVFKAKNVYEAQFKCEEICKQLENQMRHGRK